MIESLNDAKFAFGWQGAFAGRGVDDSNHPFVDIKATGTSTFCVHRDCKPFAAEDGLKTPMHNTDAKAHKKAGKIKFRLFLKPDPGCSEGRFYLRQNCWGCKQYLRVVCPVKDDTAYGILQELQELNQGVDVPSGGKRSKTAQEAEGPSEAVEAERALELVDAMETFEAHETTEAREACEATDAMQAVEAMVAGDGEEAGSVEDGTISLERFMIDLNFV